MTVEVYKRGYIIGISKEVIKVQNLKTPDLCFFMCLSAYKLEGSYFYEHMDSA